MDRLCGGGVLALNLRPAQARVYAASSAADNGPMKTLIVIEEKYRLLLKGLTRLEMPKSAVNKSPWLVHIHL